jgi:hypothetical protein
MTDAPLEEALRASGSRLGSRPLPPGLRARLLAETGRRARLRTAHSMVLALALANAVIAGVVLLSGAGGSALTGAGASAHTGAPRPSAGLAVAASALAAPARPVPAGTPLDSALIEGRRGVVDAWLEEASACRTATTAALPPNPQACRNAADLVAQAASGFAGRLHALSPPDANAPGVSDLLVTLGNLERFAQALEADIDDQAAAAVVADDARLGTAAWSADMALVYGPG